MKKVQTHSKNTHRLIVRFKHKYYGENNEEGD